MFDRAYSLLEIRQVRDDQRIIVGIATSPQPDRMGDIVEPLGVKYKNPLPLLWHHDSSSPVGTVRFDKPTKNGITFEAHLPKIDEPGPLKDRVDTAWGEVKHKLVRGVSIGFRALETSRLDDGGIRFISSEVLELSLVAIPANADATIQTIKSIDAKARTIAAKLDAKSVDANFHEIESKINDTEKLAASGQGPISVDSTTAGVTARKSTHAVKVKPMSKRTIAEAIASYEAERADGEKAFNAIMQKSVDENVTLDPAEKEEYETLQRRIEEIDEHLVRLKKHEEINKKLALPVEGKDEKSGTDTRAGVRVEVRAKDLPKGTSFTRYVLALARAKGDIMMANEIAKANEQWRVETPEVAEILKTAVTAGTTSDATWAGPLVNYQNMTAEFVEYLRPLTIIGRIPGLRRVPFKVKIPRQTGASTVNWVGEGKVKPLTSIAFDTITMEFAKIAGIIPLTDELVRFSNPAAEALVREELANAIVQFMDSQFVDPTKASNDVSPASITYGVTAVTATGTTAAALRADIKTLMATFLSYNMGVGGLVWLMTQQQALAISLMVNSLGQSQFPGLTLNGGTFAGLPVVVSENIPSTGGSPTDGGAIILLRAPDILLADDGQVTIDASREASLQMDTAPDSPPTASTNLISLWQHNMIAIKCERFVNWAKARSTSVQMIQYAKYAE